MTAGIVLHTRWQVFCLHKLSILCIYFRAFEWVCVCVCVLRVWVCVCVSQHLRVEMSGVHLPLRPWSKEKLQLAGTSCFGRKHRSAARAFLPMLEKQSVLSLYFSHQRWPVVITAKAYTPAEVRLIKKGGRCFEFVSATWTDIRETW